MAILRRIVQNIKRGCYFYNGSVVFSTVMCVSSNVNYLQSLRTEVAEHV
jgi:hypothetical protein